MVDRRRRHGAAGRRACALACAFAAALALAAPAAAQTLRLPSSCSRSAPIDPTYGGLQVVSAGDAIVTGTLYTPSFATVATPVPVVLQTHGAGGSRASLVPRSGNLTQRLLDAGYAVLNYDTRGHGDSRRDVRGQPTPRWGWNAPGAEVEDARALLRALAACRTIAQEAPGDPLAGWVGASNGGAIQLATASVDPAVDAVVPDMAWGDLPGELMPAGAPKAVIGPLHDNLVRNGVQRDPYVDRWAAEARAGAVSAEVTAWMAARSTTLAGVRVGVPTMLVQGSPDVLFPLNPALRTWSELTARGVPAKLVALCRPHGGQALPAGACPAPPDLREPIVAWLDRHVRGLPASTGPAIEWQDQAGRIRSAAAAPGTTRTVALPPAEGPPLGELRGTAGTGGDTVLAAGPAPAGPAVGRHTVAQAPADACVPLFGVPRLRLEGTLAGDSAHVFAELVAVAPDGRAATVNAQSTPLALPAGSFAVEAELAGIGWTLAPGDRLELELTAGSDRFTEPARSFAATLERVTLELPEGAPEPC